MEMRKMLKKATAIAASASFIGATMMGAAAQDLANFPAPFVKDGALDAFIVVGADAQPSDVVGAVDVGASLQFALKKVTSTGGASVATISEGVKIEKAGDKFNFDDDINKIETNTSLTEDDLPVVLADGKFTESEGANKNSESYTQRLLFSTADTARLEYAQDDDTAPTAGDYLFIDRGTELYNYTLEFDSPIDYAENASQADLKTATIVIQGKTYTITGVTNTVGTGITKLTFLSGEAVLWLTQNSPITKSVAGVEHTIEVLDVTEDADACQVKVDDTPAIIDVDETKTVNGVQIGVTDVRAIHAQLQDVDVCQISIGATELELQDGKEVKVDDVKTDGTKVYMSETTLEEFEGFSVTYKASDLDDDLYLAPGSAFTDPLFGSWKLVYGGLTASYAEYTFKRKGSDKAEFKFINNDGKEVTIPMYLNDTNNDVVRLGLGDDVDEQMLAGFTESGDNASIIGLRAYCIPTSNDVTDCEGTQILATTSNGEAHVFEITNIDFGTSKNTTDVKDLTYDRTYSDVEFTTSANLSAKGAVVSSLDLGSFGTLKMIINVSGFVVNDSINSKIELSTEGSIVVLENATDVRVIIAETDRSGNTDIADEMTSRNASIRAKADTTNEEIDIDVSTPTNGYKVDLEDGSDYKVIVSRVGTIYTVDEEDDDSVEIKMPYAEVYGNVFVAPIVAEIQTTAVGVSSYTLSKLQVGSAKLDSEISDASASNLIVVGGPCANKIAASVLGLTYPACGTDSGITKDTAMLKSVTQASGKVALVVAGWEAVDTRRATRVLSNYDQYDLSGSMVTVTGTSLTDITVTKSA